MWHRSQVRPEWVLHHQGVPFLRAVVVVGAVAALTGGCGHQARKAPEGERFPGMRPIGVEARFHPPAVGPIKSCRRRLGRRYAAHVEVFAAGRVVLVAAGIGTGRPVRKVAGRIVDARCFGSLVTIDPTGLVLIRRGTAATLGDLFDAWGQPLSGSRVAGFSGPVRAYVAGRRWSWAVLAVPLRRHAEVVVEVGPYVPPHAAYTFPEPY
jgi:hypothetical protein